MPSESRDCDANAAGFELRGTPLAVESTHRCELFPISDARSLIPDP